MRRLIFAAALGAVLLNGAPAFAQGADTPPKDDPWEHLNRRFYNFSQGLDRAILRPAAMFYSHAVPKPLRTGIRNLLSNVEEPPIIINDILQVRLKRAGKATGRFLLNSTVGIGGIFDVATGAGLEHQGTNFGITLGRYGAKPGPYVYLPVLGPSTVRGVIGTVVGAALDPLYWIRYPDKTEISIGRAVIGGLDTRAEVDGTLKSLTADATDPYATIRSAYLQNLQSQVTGEETPVQSLPDFDSTDTPGQPATTTPPATPDASAQTPPAQTSPSGTEPPAPTPPPTDTPAASPAPNAAP